MGSGTTAALGFGGTPVVVVYTATVGLLDVPASLEGIPVLPEVTGEFWARVSDGSKTFALSNNHVFANRNDANKGDDILQPGRVDGGTDPANSIGTLHDYEPLRFCSVLSCPGNRIDAAIA